MGSNREQEGTKEEKNKKHMKAMNKHGDTASYTFYSKLGWVSHDPAERKREEAVLRGKQSNSFWAEPLTVTLTSPILSRRQSRSGQIPQRGEGACLEKGKTSIIISPRSSLLIPMTFVQLLSVHTEDYKFLTYGIDLYGIWVCCNIWRSQISSSFGRIKQALFITYVVGSKSLRPQCKSCILYFI